MISLNHITLRRASKVLLSDASVTIQAGEKVGLVGRNGAGKSSLFALLTGDLSEDKGDFFMPAGWRLAQVAQAMPETSESATQFVLGGDTRLRELEQSLLMWEQEPDQNAAGPHIAELHAQLHDAGAHNAQARAQSLILGLGFGAHELHAPVNSFSGGWRMRLQLARALICPADLLLLDEPTNHLDLDALVWLESWLKRFEGTMLVISHDREFLDAVTQVTLHIDAGSVTRFSGNYSWFEEQRALRMGQQQAAFTKQQEKIAHLQSFIDRFKAKATKAKQAQSRVKALERMERIAPVLAESDFQFEFRAAANIPNPMLSIQNASLGYHSDTGNTIVLTDMNRCVLAGQRIGILGANGQGKSTFVKTVAKQMKALSGQITEGKGLAIGYFAQQELDVLHESSSPLEHMIRLARDIGPPGREQELRNFLGNFLFTGNMVGQAVGSMSGGEKARLVLAMVVWQKPNLLLLDEPTNHLDLATREALQVALNEFEGTVMLVSHDRAMLRSVCDEFWLVGNGQVKAFDGDLEDYQQHLLEVARERKESLRPKDHRNQPSARLTNKEQRQQDARERSAAAEKIKPLKVRMKHLEEDIARWTTEQSSLHAALTEPMPTEQMIAAHKRLAALTQDIEDAEWQWLEISERIDGLNPNTT